MRVITAHKQAPRPLVSWLIGGLILFTASLITGCHGLLAGEPYSADASYTYYGELAFINAVLWGDHDAMEAGLHLESPRLRIRVAEARQDFPLNLKYRPADGGRVEGYIEADGTSDNDQVVEVYTFDVREAVEGEQRRFEVLRVYDWEKQ